MNGIMVPTKQTIYGNGQRPQFRAQDRTHDKRLMLSSVSLGGWLMNKNLLGTFMRVAGKIFA